LKTLPAWFTLNAYGKEGYKQIVEDCSVLANQFGDFITENDSFELLAPVRLNTVCFTLKDEEKVIPFLSQLNDTGKVFMTATVYSGRKGIRAAFVNWMTTENDLLITTKLMTTIIEELK
jgi:glutamate/tyrosine decarboxylase-like PLP-dependent enzyme